MSIPLLAARAELYRSIRDYFSQQQVLEVDVPVIGRTAALDPNLESLAVLASGGTYYLQTSPEFFHKRLLAQGSGSIYSLTHAFRQGEQGTRHNPEFTLLEWYRVGYDMDALIEDVLSLLHHLKPGRSVSRFSYAEVFQRHLSIDPHQVSDETLNSLVAQHTSYQGQLARDAALQLLMSDVVEPQFPAGITVIHHFPASQAALAQIEKDEEARDIALRFEVFWNGLELANGYQELNDASEQRTRFEAEQRLRAQQGLQVPTIDEKFLRVLNDIPACSGVALGVDRLLMCLTGAETIQEVQTFPWPDL